METKELIQIERLDANLLPELQGWKEKQEKLVNDNPFIDIIDNKTYEEGKKRRTALLKGRTGLENQDKLVGSKLRNFRLNVSETTKTLVEISFPHEAKQQDEVKRYEAVKIAERNERERLEYERKQKIKNNVNNIFNSWKETISKLTFNKIDSFNMGSKLSDLDTAKFEEFEPDFVEKHQLLKNLFSEKVQQLKHSENQRLEDLRLRKDREEFEKKQDESRKIQEAEDKKRQEHQYKIDAENKKKADELNRKGKEIQDEKKRLKKIEDERLEKEKKILEAEEQKKKHEADKKRIESLKPDVEKLKHIIRSVTIPISEIEDLNESVSKSFLSKIQNDVSDLKSKLLLELDNIYKQ